MIKRITTLIILLSYVFLNQSISEIYKWKDSKGQYHFSDSPPNNKDSEKLNETELARNTSSIKNVMVNIVFTDYGVNREKNKLVMYTTTQCGYCKKARQYFAKNNIRYIEKNIQLSKVYKREFNKFGGKGVPVIFIGKYRMDGFSVGNFERLMAKIK